jgi:hypothetical protein
MARPTLYTEELATEICERISGGESLCQIVLLEHMPCEKTVYNWIDAHPEFLQKYTHAVDRRTDFWAEEIISIADDSRNDWVERENQRTHETYVAVNEEAIARARLRIDSRFRLMAKQAPKKYGDKLDVTSQGDKIAPAYIILSPEAAEKI